MGISDNFTCLLRNLYVDQEVTVRTLHATNDWFKIGKGEGQVCILSPCLFKFHAEYIMRKAGLDEAQTGIRIAGRNINNLTYVDDTTLMAKSEPELRSLLMKVKKKNEKAGLKLNIQKLRSSYPVPSLVANRREKSESSDRLWVPKSLQMELQPWNQKTLAPWKKSMTNLDSVLKSRNITLLKKVCQSYGFSSSHVQYYSGP